jgi:hypothetical protein
MSRGVVHGVNGINEGRISIRRSHSRSMANTTPAVVWPLLEAGGDLVVDGRWRADDEQTTRGGHLLARPGVLEHVLHLRPTVEGRLRSAPDGACP